MRICHILETSGGGSGRVVLDLVEAGIASGDEITVVYSPLRAETPFLDKLKSFGSSVKRRAIPMRRSVGFHDMIHAFRLGVLLLREGPFDVVHAHSSKAGGLARIVRFAAHGATMIYSPHAFVTMQPNVSSLYRLIEKALAPCTDGIVCVSEGERAHAANDLGLPVEKLYVVPNGTKPCASGLRAIARERMSVGPETCVVGFVGRFVDQKEPLRVLRAFEAQAVANPNIVLTMVGDGPLRAEVEAEAEKVGLAARVKTVGEQASVSYLPGFDVVVCGSAYEALSLVFLEALAAGVPIVTTPVGGAHECVVSGQTGFVAEAFTDSALSEALGLYLTQDAEARERMAQAARGRSSAFTLRGQADAMRDVYATCLQRRLGKAELA